MEMNIRFEILNGFLFNPVHMKWKTVKCEIKIGKNWKGDEEKDSTEIQNQTNKIK